jgi:hypothetical protein
MLTADLVRVYPEGDGITVRPLSPKVRPRLLEFATYLIDSAAEMVGEPREGVETTFGAFALKPAERRLAEGLKKLVLDRCDFGTDERFGPPALRAEVFLAAAAARRASTDDAEFDRDAVLAPIAAAHGAEVAEVDAGLFADLKQAQKLRRFDSVAPERLLDAYELGQAQAVLLRATRVVATVTGGTVGDHRALFRSLKFHRLLYRVAAAPGSTSDAPAHRIEIEGPHALFSASTRYGLQLAVVLPAIRCFPKWAIEADVLWGTARVAQVFRISGEARVPLDAVPDALPEEVVRLVEKWPGLDSPWSVRRASRILDLPGVGLCVPDLVFTHSETRQRVYLEALGFWSRAAVWQRVDLSTGAGRGKGLNVPIVYAVSERLRVSEQVLDGELPAALYVFKGTMSAKTVLARVEQVAKAHRNTPGTDADDAD